VIEDIVFFSAEVEKLFNLNVSNFTRVEKYKTDLNRKGDQKSPGLITCFIELTCKQPNKKIVSAD
jgi:hypothetical protein